MRGLILWPGGRACCVELLEPVELLDELAVQLVAPELDTRSDQARPEAYRLDPRVFVMLARRVRS